MKGVGFMAFGLGFSCHNTVFHQFPDFSPRLQPYFFSGGLRKHHMGI